MNFLKNILSIFLLLSTGSALGLTQDTSLIHDSLRPIVFVGSLPQKNGSLFLTYPETSSEMILLTEEGDNFSPQLSENGEKLYFLSTRDITPKSVDPSENIDPSDMLAQIPAANLFVMDLKTRETTQITKGESKVWNFSVSPNGKLISFLSNRDTTPALYIVDTSGAHLKKVSTKNWIFEGAIWLSNEVLLYNNWLPNKTLELFSYHVKSGVHKQITKSKIGTKNGYVDLSPNRKQLVMVSRDVKRDDSLNIINPQIFLMDTDGTNRCQLLHNDCVDFEPRWSSNGEWISFFREETSDQDTGLALLAIKKDGTNERKLNDPTFTPAISHCWRKNRPEIMFTVVENDFQKIQILNIDTHKLQVISKEGWNFSQPSN